MAIVGIACQIAFAVALFRVAPYLAPFFSTLAYSGIGDPATLVGAFEETFGYCAIELMIGLIGLVCLCISLAVGGYRAGWFIKFLTIYGTFLLFIFPVGTAFGIFFLAFRPRKSA